jgi:chromate transporter
MVLPAFFSILLLMALLRTVRDNIYVVGALTGIKAVSVALILVTIFQLAQTLRLKVFGWVIALLSFGLIVFLKFNAILVLVGSGAAGFLLYFWTGRKERGDR